MSPQQLREWQQWQQQCFAGSPSCAVMSGVCGFVRWSSVAVQHCHGAQGLVLEHSQGWKLVYSGERLALFLVLTKMVHGHVWRNMEAPGNPQKN